MPPPRMGAMRALHSVLLVVPLLATEHCEPNADWLLQTAVQLQTVRPSHIGARRGRLGRSIDRIIWHAGSIYGHIW